MVDDGNKHNEAKVLYLLSLLGKKPQQTGNLDDDSDYSDIILTRMNLMLPNKLITDSHWFEPTRILVEDDDFVSPTSEAQHDVEESVIQSYEDNHQMNFNLDNHIKYIENSLSHPLPAGYIAYDANHTWMIYWLTNSYNLIVPNCQFLQSNRALVKEKIASCIINDGKGGIGGGSNQFGHLASAYAAILTLVSIKEYSLLQQIRGNLYAWIMSLKLPDGSFKMHYNGESDTRSTYCALIISSLLNIQTPKLLFKCREYLNSCQTFEGGFSGVPGTEAHGGYTFCALASYFLLYNDKFEFYSQESFNLNALIRWATMQQYQLEGGLVGRTNKLVDACYSFWIGGCYAMLETLTDTPNSSLFSRIGLKNYILRCCQNKFGGFKDKPGKPVDFYHTNYTLCGLSICEHELKLNNNLDMLAYTFESSNIDKNQVTAPLNPVFGLPLGLGEACKVHFTKPKDH